ncbi:hypothetical protein EYF80_005431 [Liparis tanakae]|uniref:Uncharacterized protein n=1 Tax=Liparis tanakae TaxID=230148 RepID=A0A4Z2J421_9TELE|nr:hypothetical protein EYF80_005431 [Liparis tanakae]
MKLRVLFLLGERPHWFEICHVNVVPEGERPDLVVVPPLGLMLRAHLADQLLHFGSPQWILCHHRAGITGTRNSAVPLETLASPCTSLLQAFGPMPKEYLPDVACVAANQLDNFACVAGGSVSEQEEEAGVSAEHRLPQDPTERRQDVGPPHVGSDLPNIITGQRQGFLR